MSVDKLAQSNQATRKQFMLVCAMSAGLQANARYKNIDRAVLRRADIKISAEFGRHAFSAESAASLLQHHSCLLAHTRTGRCIHSSRPTPPCPSSSTQDFPIPRSGLQILLRKYRLKLSHELAGFNKLNDLAGCGRGAGRPRSLPAGTPSRPSITSTKQS